MGRNHSPTPCAFQQSGLDASSSAGRMDSSCLGTGPSLVVWSAECGGSGVLGLSRSSRRGLVVSASLLRHAHPWGLTLGTTACWRDLQNVERPGVGALLPAPAEWPAAGTVPCQPREWVSPAELSVMAASVPPACSGVRNPWANSMHLSPV